MEHQALLLTSSQFPERFFRTVAKKVTSEPLEKMSNTQTPRKTSGTVGVLTLLSKLNLLKSLVSVALRSP